MRPQFRRRVVGGGKLPAFRAFDYEAHSDFASFVLACLKSCVKSCVKCLRHLLQVSVRRFAFNRPCNGLAKTQAQEG